MARPSERSKKTEALIIERILSGASLTRICKDNALPALSTVFKWLADDKARRASGTVKPGEPSFLDEYEIALDIRNDLHREEALDIADDGTNDFCTDFQGNQVVNHDHIQRSRLRVQYRQWLMAVMAPKRYGKAAETAVNINAQTHIHNHISLEKQKELQERMRVAQRRNSSVEAAA
ncbi:MAG: hypothetical protein H0W20_01865 [Chthoniobacterales bacterium]|nr:hypothetical protein [Chthoniobacterales bacterium]